MKTKDFIIIGLALVIFYLSTCNKPQTIETEKTEHYKDSTTTITIDSSEIEGSHKNLTAIQKRDSIITKDSTVLVYDTIPVEAIPLGLDTFYYNIKDSLLEAKITAFSKERPYIDFDYKMKSFEIKERTIIKDSVYHERVKSYLSAGVMLTGSQSSFGFAPQLQYNHKTGINVGIGYDIINRNYHLGFTKRISFK